MLALFWFQVSIFRIGFTKLTMLTAVTLTNNNCISPHSKKLHFSKNTSLLKNFVRQNRESTKGYSR